MKPANRFDAAAATWDEKPARHELAKSVAKAISEAIPLSPAWRALEYGCGTASLSIMLSNSLGRIVCADNSEGMIEEAERKIRRLQIANIETALLDLEKQAPPEGRFDLVFSCMSLHHVADTARLARSLVSMLKNGGWLAVADLEKEDGSFHSDCKVPHNGFDSSELARTLSSFGLLNPQIGIIHSVVKNERTYPVFLLTANKAASPPHGDPAREK